MPFNNRWKAEFGAAALICLEFSGITIWAFFTGRSGILLSSTVLAIIGFLFTAVKIYEVKFQDKLIDDERIEMLTEQAYLISAIAGIIMLPQIAILEIITETSISALDTFVIVANTFLIVFLVVEMIQHYFLS